MYEKNLKIGYLLDFYGELLPDRKRSVMEMYYNEDLSLSEIAAELDISRQGVRDIIKKSEEELFFFEEKLGLAKKLRSIEEKADLILKRSASDLLPQELSKEISSLITIIRE